MTHIGSLLDQETITRLQGVAALSPDMPAKPHSTAEVEIDPRSAALIEAACFYCEANIDVDPTVPEGVDPEQERRFTCDDCAKTRVHDAIQAQRNVEIIRRKRVAKHEPRTTDGVTHPVVITKKETRVKIDLDEYSDAELGALVRKRMKQQLAVAMPEAQAEAKAQVKADDEADTVLRDVERVADRIVVPGFRVDATLEVPDLDTTDVPTLDQVVPSEIRSIYNKARFRMLGQESLSKDVTYRFLLNEHKVLAHLAERVQEEAKGKVEKRLSKTIPTSKPAKPVKVVAALDNEGEAKALIKAKTKAMVAAGVDPKTAKGIAKALVTGEPAKIR